MWTNVRIAGYLMAVAVAGGTLASMLGVAEFDRETGLLDLHPVNVYSVASLIAPVLASCIASVAALLGWGRKT